MREFRLNPWVKWRWEGKDKILLNTMVGMNRTAGEILELCEKIHNQNDITEEMSKKYPDVPREKLQSGVKKLIGKLLKWKILVPEGFVEPKLPFATALYAQHIASYFKNQLSAPVGVACEITLACNARCPHCSVFARTGHEFNELSTDDWKDFIDELHDLNVFSITFLGGEPLLRKDLEELLNYASQRGLRTVVVTNGYLLAPNKISSLCDAGLDEVQLSLDGTNAETHDSFRGIEGLFKRVIGAIPVLKNKKVRVAILTTVMRMNLEQIPEIMKLVNSLSVDSLNLMSVMRIGRASWRKDFFPSTEEYVELIRQIYDEEQNTRKTFIIYPGLPAYYYEKSIGLEEYERFKHGGKIGTCVAGITHCTITSIGDVRPCGVSADITLGNIKETSFREIWNDDTFKLLRNLRKNVQNPCKMCRLCDICWAGCRALPSQIGMEGDPYVADPICLKCFEKMKTDNVQLQ